MPKSSLPVSGLVLGLSLLLPGMASALNDDQAPRMLTWQPPIEREVHGNYMGEPGIDPDMLTEGFLSSHPDIRWRREGLYSYNKEEYDIAMAQFLRAARHADKAAQAMIAEMYWNGIGVPRDREIAYAWMDLAAERMYPNFVILRERYWQHLDQRQRRNAIDRGQPLLAEYGDDAAKPRMERQLRIANHQITGSRLGFVGNLKIRPFTGPAAGQTFTAELYYKPEYWRTNRYFEWKDRMWHAPERSGHVDVGNVQQVDDASEPDHQRRNNHSDPTG